MKNHHHDGPVAPQPNSKGVIHETIAMRAYSLWLSHGQPENQADEIWLEAERELHSERAEG